MFVQANMATWSKNELATALGTNQDSDRAHELGMPSPHTEHGEHIQCAT